jgi:hypothetical protein
LAEKFEKPPEFGSFIQKKKKEEETFTYKMPINNHEISRSQIPYWNYLQSHRVENSISQTMALFISFLPVSKPQNQVLELRIYGLSHHAIFWKVSMDQEICRRIPD